MITLYIETKARWISESSNVGIYVEICYIMIVFQSCISSSGGAYP